MYPEPLHSSTLSCFEKEKSSLEMEERVINRRKSFLTAIIWEVTESWLPILCALPYYISSSLLLYNTPTVQYVYTTVKLDL